MNKPTKRLAPISVRVTESERVLLESFSTAAGLSVSAYIKWCVFASDKPKPKSRSKTPVKDHEALGSILGELGQSQISSNLAELAEAASSGSLPVTSETETKLLKAIKDISYIRHILIQALGLKPMILKGSQRGGAMNLGRHLLKQENEHVEEYQVR